MYPKSVVHTLLHTSGKADRVRVLSLGFGLEKENVRFCLVGNLVHVLENIKSGTILVLWKHSLAVDIDGLASLS